MISDSNIPRDLRQLRACLVCSMVKSTLMFEEQGCENCENLLNMRGDTEKVDACTSSNFDGMIALTEPEDSWVGRWQGIKTTRPGLYAISVSGTLSREIVIELREHGFRYRPEMRDRSQAQ
ncbi:Transcription elongation factor SPT4 [Aphelenchoides bicaudatus]|nr:Transcription elongation factor SPT4 [Aphelenchoides bicaudatus]